MTKISENNKRKVSTSTRDLYRKSDQIRRCMKGYPEGITPKAIAAKTRLNVNTVKSILPKMSDVRRVMRGLYKVANEGDGVDSLSVELEDWNFHNCVLTCDKFEYFQPSFVRDWGLVKFDVSVGVDSGKATCRVSSDWPLNVSSIVFVAGYFSDLIAADLGDVFVSTVEFNRDYSNLRLDGVQSISVTNLVEQFKVYQKQRGLRIEHKTSVPLLVEDVVDMLGNSPNTLDFNIKLNEQRRVLDRLVSAVQSNAQMTEALIRARGGELHGEEDRSS